MQSIVRVLTYLKTLETHQTTGRIWAKVKSNIVSALLISLKVVSALLISLKVETLSTNAL